MKDPYIILGVDYEATDSEIKKKYYALAKKYHPDNFASDPKEAEVATRKMSEINEAYAQIEKDRAAGIRGKAAYEAPKEKPQPPKSEKSRWEKKSEGAYTGGGYSPFVGYKKLRAYINEGGFEAVEIQLFLVPGEERGAEWHYLYSLALWARHYIHDAFREINLACRLDRRNKEYKKTRAEMKKNGTVLSEAARKKQEENRPQRPSRRRRFWRRIADCLLDMIGLDDREL